MLLDVGQMHPTPTQMLEGHLTQCQVPKHQILSITPPHWVDVHKAGEKRVHMASIKVPQEWPHVHQKFPCLHILSHYFQQR